MKNKKILSLLILAVSLAVPAVAQATAMYRYEYEAENATRSAGATVDSAGGVVILPAGESVTFEITILEDADYEIEIVHRADNGGTMTVTVDNADYPVPTHDTFFLYSYYLPIRLNPATHAVTVTANAGTIYVDLIRIHPPEGIWECRDDFGLTCPGTGYQNPGSASWNQGVLNPGFYYVGGKYYDPTTGEYPFPENDNDVYFSVTVSAEWSSDYSRSPYIDIHGPIVLPESEQFSSGPISCGENTTSGSCTYTLAGIISAPNTNTDDFRFSAGLAGLGTGDVVTQSVNVLVTNMPTNRCAQAYELGAQLAAGTIDASDPNGILMALESSYNGHSYAIAISGSYLDGAIQRQAAEINIDNAGWQLIADGAPDTSCWEFGADGQVIYFDIPASLTPMDVGLRAFDGDGDWTNNSGTLIYILYDAIPAPEPGACSSQFTAGDVVAENIIVPAFTTQAAIDFGIGLNATFTPGAWYAIETTAPWQNAGLDEWGVKYAWVAKNAGDGNNWVWTSAASADCADGAVMYTQATADGLLLTIDDPDTPDNNSGQATVTIRAVERTTREKSGCELVYATGDYLWEVTVDGTQINVPLIPPTVTILPEIQPTDALAFVDGQPYMFETSGFWTEGATGQISAGLEISTDGGATWEPLASWSGADCITQIDPIGHVKIYFTGDSTLDYRLRVRDADGNYPNNGGAVTVTMFEAIPLQIILPGGDPIPPPHLCDGGYDRGDLLYRIPDVVASADAGVGLPHTIGTTPLPEYVALETTGGPFDDNGTPWHGAQIFDGADWYSWLTYPGALCYEDTGDGHWRIYMQMDAARQWAVRADDLDGDWTNNTGQLGVDMYSATPLIDPWNRCEDNYTWVEIESGELLANQALTLNMIPGQLYAIEMTGGQWYEGDDPAPRYDWQITQDGGASWYAPSEPTAPGAQCYVKYAVYDKLFLLAVNDPASGQYAQIRVADVDGNMSNNSGALHYVLYAVAQGGEDIEIDDYAPPQWATGCFQSPMRPSDPLDIAAWVDYAWSSVVNFFLWCPEHTQAMQAIYNALLQREPFYSVQRAIDVLKTIRADMNTYAWTTDNAPMVPFTPGGGGDMPAPELITPLNQTPFGGAPFVPPATGGQSATNWGSCESHLAAAWGDSDLVTGYCSILLIIKNTGFGPWLQLMVTFGAVWLGLRYIFRLPRRVSREVGG